jgi:hypothetical protein
VSFPTKPDPQKTLSRPEAEKLAACWRKQTFKPFDRDIDGKIYPEYVICFYTGQKKLALKVGINFKAQAIDLMDSDTVATFKAVAS